MSETNEEKLQEIRRLLSCPGCNRAERLSQMVMAVRTLTDVVEALVVNDVQPNDHVEKLEAAARDLGLARSNGDMPAMWRAIGRIEATSIAK